MKKVEAIIRIEKLEDVIETLRMNWINSVTISDVFRSSDQTGYIVVYRDVEFNASLIPKKKVEVVIRDEDVDKVVEIITRMGRTGKMGDGIIVLDTVENAIRIRTGYCGDYAL